MHTLFHFLSILFSNREKYIYDMKKVADILKISADLSLVKPQTRSNPQECGSTSSAG